MNIVRNRWTHATVVVVAAVGVVLLLWWRGPAWGAVGDVFRAVEWKWVAAAVGLNLLSVLVRALVCGELMRPTPTNVGRQGALIDGWSRNQHR